MSIALLETTPEPAVSTSGGDVDDVHHYFCCCSNTVALCGYVQDDGLGFMPTDEDCEHDCPLCVLLISEGRRAPGCPQRRAA